MFVLDFLGSKLGGGGGCLAHIVTPLTHRKENRNLFYKIP